MASPVTASPEAEISIKMRNSNGTHRGMASNDSYRCELIPVLKDLRRPRTACKSNIQQGLLKVLSFDSERTGVHLPRGNADLHFQAKLQAHLKELAVGFSFVKDDASLSL